MQIADTSELLENRYDIFPPYWQQLVNYEHIAIGSLDNNMRCMYNMRLYNTCTFLQTDTSLEKVSVFLGMFSVAIM